MDNLKNRMGLRWDHVNVPYRIFKNPPEFQTLVKKISDREQIAADRKAAHNYVNGKNTRDY